MDDREDGAVFLDALADSSDESSALADEGFHGVRSTADAASPVKNSAQAKDPEELDATVAAPEQALQALTFLEFQKQASTSHTRADHWGRGEPASDPHDSLMQALDSTVMADVDSGLVDSIDELDSTIVVQDDDQAVDDEFDATVVCDVEEDLLVGEQPLSNVELSDLDATVLLETLPESAGFLQEFDAVAPAPPVIRQLAPIGGSGSSASAGARAGVWVETPPLRPRGARGSVFFVLALVVFLGAYFYAEHIRAFFSAAAPTMPTIVDATGSAAAEAPLSASQQADEIRYCITQGIRLNSAADNVAGLGRVAVSRLQSMFDVYDKRCANSDFDPAVYVATYRSVDADRARIEQQGVALLGAALVEAAPVAKLKKPGQPVTLKLLDAQSPVEVVAVEMPAGVSGEAASVPLDTKPVVPVSRAVSAARPEAAGVFSSIFTDTESSHRTVKDIQWRLFKLGFYNGRFDGVFADNTRQALLAFFRDGKVAPIARDVASYDEREIFQLVDSAYTSW